MAQAAKLKASNEQILQIVDQIRHSTIDSILGMDEFELMEALVIALESSRWFHCFSRQFIKN